MNMNDEYRFPRSNISELSKLRQAITTIEEVLDTTNPGTFTIDVLIAHIEIINNAIDVIRHSDNQLGKNEKPVLNHLRNARDNFQLAIDEFFFTQKGKKRRYQYIRYIGEELRNAIANWNKY